MFARNVQLGSLALIIVSIATCCDAAGVAGSSSGEFNVPKDSPLHESWKQFEVLRQNYGTKQPAPQSSSNSQAKLPSPSLSAPKVGHASPHYDFDKKILGEPMTESRLMQVLTELFRSDRVMPAELVHDRLEAIDGYYHQIHSFVPIDTRNLLSFANDIEDKCDDVENYYAVLKANYNLAESKYPALKDYLEECFKSLEGTCNLEDELVLEFDQTFKPEHNNGWKIFESLTASFKFEKLRNTKKISDTDLAANALKNAKLNQRSAHELRKFCQDLVKLAVSHDLDRFDSARMINDGVKIIAAGVKLCRLLEHNKY